LRPATAQRSGVFAAWRTSARTACCPVNPLAPRIATSNCLSAMVALLVMSARAYGVPPLAGKLLDARKL
jgi:hypothetical protein